MVVEGSGSDIEDMAGCSAGSPCPHPRVGVLSRHERWDADVRDPVQLTHPTRSPSWMQRAAGRRLDGRAGTRPTGVAATARFEELLEAEAVWTRAWVAHMAVDRTTR